MSDIEQLRQNVIDAARAYVRGPGNGDFQLAKDWDVLVERMDALDAAERPDPWALLRAAYDWMMSDLPQTDRSADIADALAWHDKQEQA